MTVVVPVEGAGALVIEQVDGLITIEAIAIADSSEARAIVIARHAALELAVKELFPSSSIVLHDPLGLRGGAKSVAS